MAGHRDNGSTLTFIEHYCQIHGHYGSKVYRHTRNGLPWVYDYEFKPKYDPTVLSRRSDCIAKVAASVSNPQYKDYSEVAGKIYYYTPYFVYAGTYSFTCNTFLKLRQRGVYGFQTGDMQMQVKLAPRTKLTLTFNEHKTYQVLCYKNGTMYSQREVVVIGDDEDLESVYADWFDEHLAEILLLSMPHFGALKVYRHGIVPPAWISSMTGKTDEGILYRNQRNRFMYS